MTKFETRKELFSGIIGALKPIPGWPGYYASDFGKIWSSKSYKCVRTRHTSRGYSECKLSHNGFAKTQLVHRLVCKAFHGQRDSTWTVNHKNLIKDDNRPENLEWMSESDNKQHAFKNNRFKSGVRHYSSKLTQDQVEFIRAQKGIISQSVLAKKFGTCQSAISRIQRGNTYGKA